MTRRKDEPTRRRRRSRGAAGWIVLGLLVGCLGFSETNAASTRKYWPGTLCRPDDEAANFIAASGTLFNGTSQRQKVSCALERDTGRIQLLYIWLWDKHPSQNVTCSLQTRLWDGTVKYWTVKSSYSAPTTNNGAETMILVGGPPVTFSHFTLECFVPGVFNNQFSGIISIWATEVSP